MARPHSNAVEFSSVNKGMLQVMMVLTAGLLVNAESSTANEHSFQRLLSTPAAGATSENYLLASSIPSSYGFTWPTPSAEIVRTNADHPKSNNYGPAIRFGEPSGEIEREAIWAKADVGENVKRVQFENFEFVKFHSDAMSSGRDSRDTLAWVGYVSSSKPLHRYLRNKEYSIAWF